MGHGQTSLTERQATLHPFIVPTAFTQLADAHACMGSGHVLQLLYRPGD